MTPSLDHLTAEDMAIAYKTVVDAWNEQADSHNQWDKLDEQDERIKINYAIVCAVYLIVEMKKP